MRVALGGGERWKGKGKGRYISLVKIRRGETCMKETIIYNKAIS